MSRSRPRTLMSTPAPALGDPLRLTRFRSRSCERLMLRLQVRDILVREQFANAYSNDIASTVALQWSWRGKSKDADLDGVRNWLDKCPGTPIGAKVDANGGPIDSEKDGGFDGLDKGPHTSTRAHVGTKRL